jgi:vacuolar-type H+-ATPase subunit I/STV1
MFDKKIQRYPKGKVLWYIDGDTKQKIRKTKIYGYKHGVKRKGSFLVLTKVQYIVSGQTGDKIVLQWKYTEPNRFHENLSDAKLFAKTIEKIYWEKRINNKEAKIEQMKKSIKEIQEMLEEKKNLQEFEIEKSCSDILHPDSHYMAF